MLVRNPKKRPSATKMLTVSSAHSRVIVFGFVLCYFCIRLITRCLRRLKKSQNMPQHTSFTPFTHANEPLPLDFSITQPWLLPVSYAVRPGAGFKPWGIACFLTFSASLSWCLSLCSLQHTFLTHQCLNQELTLDLLEKYRHPEKLKSCLVTDDEEMEVRLMKLSVCVAVPASDVLGLIVCFAVI